MTTRMLIDARHQEETRVAVVKGNRIEEFDFESAEHKQIKGNIYLAKVTRVEPSLQAAFVDYGGNRHGFLAFSEIHPDYYQIPKEDREALLAEEARHAEEEAKLRDEEEEAEDEEDGDASADGDDGAGDDADNDDGGDTADEESSDAFADELAASCGIIEEDAEPIEAETLASDDGDIDGDGEDDEESESARKDSDGEKENRNRRGRRGRGRAKASDEARSKRMALRRRYKIQDVIHRRQVLLVQVVKEERGNKGAALTTYLSLAGRYCVLMPNSSHGGGISRKISSASDRKRLKSIIADLQLPSTMGCIVRTAGLSRTKTEIKRDFDYLARLWDEIREKTLKASAPENIHSDSDLIKRAIRDIYNRDIEEVLVEGEDGYRAAKDFMKLLMPSHARRVKSYSDPVPLFQRYGAEDQLSAMYEPMVQLKSGGYLVINPTEALVSIDINSGRSTKEHGIEATAVNTNLEAAREIARQLRLRDMAGLVVIDFIDMEYGSNVRKVEKAMRDALKSDRARIQVGRISGFGLMEMSRQRLRTGVLEASTRTCPHCDGTGLVRTASSAGLSALRMLEEEAAKGKGSLITLRTSQEATIYVLNNKRGDIAEIESRYGVNIEILPNGENEGAKMEVASSGPRPDKIVTFEPIVDDDDDEDLEDFADEGEDEIQADEEREGGQGRKRRRRRNRRGRKDRDGDRGEQSAETSDEAGPDDEESAEAGADDAGEDKPRRSRRGRRGGRRKRGNGEAGARTADDEAGEAADVDANASQGSDATDGGELSEAPSAEDIAVEAASEEAAEKPKRRRSRVKKAEPEAEAAEEPEAAPVAPEVAADETAAEKPKRKPRRKAAAKDDAPAEAAEESAPEAKKPARAKRTSKAAKPAEAVEAPSSDNDNKGDETASTADGDAGDGDETDEKGQPRRGWWQRTFGN
ncbi:MAG: ribonuclease E/G [Blastomonas sp.]